jgi:hypothetical protein
MFSELRIFGLGPNLRLSNYLVLQKSCEELKYFWPIMEKHPK